MAPSSATPACRWAGSEHPSWARRCANTLLSAARTFLLWCELGSTYHCQQMFLNRGDGLTGHERAGALIDVLAEAHPEIRGLSPRFVQGTFNDVVVLDGKWAARFPRTGAVLAQAPRRAAAMRLIGG